MAKKNIMKKYFTKFIRFGKYKTKDGKELSCVDCAQGEELDRINLVEHNKWNRYWNLVSKKNNNTISLEETQELENMVVCLAPEDLMPADEIRFIDGHYNDLFRVRNMSEIMINGCVNLAVWNDEYHTTLYRKQDDGTYTGGRCFHICEMGEIAHRNEWNYYPLEREVLV